MDAMGEIDRSGHAVYRELFDRIIRQEYEPGTWLREDSLAREFAVSRTPVREALSQLTQDGLVRLIPRRGSQVVGFSVDDLEEAYDMRRALEVLALERGIALVRIADLIRIRQAIEEAGPLDDPARHAELDSLLHQTIIDSANSPRLAAALGTLYRIMQTFRELGFEEESVRAATTAEHLELIDALATRDLERSRSLLSDHVSRSKSRILAAVLRRGSAAGFANAGTGKEESS
jgi:DNA-binding GntR family transcriptional regulator